MNDAELINFQDGSQYEGHLKDGKFQGAGKYIFANGSSYVGEFKNDEFDGLGTLTYNTKSYYKGEFKNGKFNGRGSLFNITDESTLEGEFREGSIVIGKLICRDGSIYTGEFRNNTPHGKGTLINSLNENFKLEQTGDWKDGLFSGTGVCTLLNGETKLFEFIDGKILDK